MTVTGTEVRRLVEEYERAVMPIVGLWDAVERVVASAALGDEAARALSRLFTAGNDEQILQPLQRCASSLVTGEASEHSLGAIVARVRGTERDALSLVTWGVVTGRIGREFAVLGTASLLSLGMRRWSGVWSGAAVALVAVLGVGALVVWRLWPRTLVDRDPDRDRLLGRGRPVRGSWGWVTRVGRAGDDLLRPAVVLAAGLAGERVGPSVTAVLTQRARVRAHVLGALLRTFTVGFVVLCVVQVVAPFR